MAEHTSNGKQCACHAFQTSGTCSHVDRTSPYRTEAVHRQDTTDMHWVVEQRRLNFLVLCGELSPDDPRIGHSQPR